MAIKRYLADADNTITNAFDSSLTLESRGTGSNMGRSDILEVFSIYDQISGSSFGESQELSRVLVNFPIATVSADRTAGRIPAAGSVSFYLRMFNAEHSETLPRDYEMTIQAVSRSWEEGEGLDMDNYTDQTYNKLEGSNWISASLGTPWTSVGGDYHASPSYTASFGRKGTENIELDITSLVEQWLDGTKTNYGVGVRLSSSYEAYYSSSTGQNSSSFIHNTDGAQRSYYTKKFFARESEFFFRRPILEARWDSRIEDDRNYFFYSSSLAPAADNLNTIYLYNYVRGRLANIPSVGQGAILVSLYSGSSNDTAPSGSKLLLPAGGGVVSTNDLNVTGGWVSTGIYSASFAVTAASTPVATLYDVWHSGGVEFKTGSISPQTFDALGYNDNRKYVINVTNLKKSYDTSETGKFRLFVREKNWNPNIYTRAVAAQSTLPIVSASYKVIRVADNYEVIGHGTGSTTNHTLMSYDSEGNYFDLDMSMLEPGYMYGLKFAFYNDAVGDYQEQKGIFKFRVEEDNNE